MKRVARNLYALRKAATETLKWHWDSPERPGLRRAEGCEYPRFFPFFDSYTGIDERYGTSKNVKFVYVKALEDGPCCVTFLARKFLGSFCQRGELRR